MRACIFLLDWTLSFTVLEIRRLKCRKLTTCPTPLLFRLKFGGVPFGVGPRFWVCREKKGWANYPWNYCRRIPTHVITVPHRHRQTDIRTDTQTTYHGITELRAVKWDVRRKDEGVRWKGCSAPWKIFFTLPCIDEMVIPRCVPFRPLQLVTVDGRQFITVISSLARTWLKRRTHMYALGLVNSRCPCEQDAHWCWLILSSHPYPLTSAPSFSGKLIAGFRIHFFQLQQKQQLRRCCH